jgi:hypothetical protein
VSFTGLDAAAAELDNGHGGKGVSAFHLRKVLKGERPSDSLLAQVRERFPHLLDADGNPWRRAGAAGAGAGAEGRRPAPIFGL